MTERKMSVSAKIVIVVSAVIIVLLFCTMGLRAYNMTTEQTQDIGRERAAEIVFTDANVTQETVTQYRLEADYNNGRRVYEIDFRYGGYEYEYEVDAASGEIIKYDKDYER
ncbi:MAG: PepSY domain-containing protein [Clostridia bacterium]|nr:PepSY domain-containing protein [Clostridia bacterium]